MLRLVIGALIGGGIGAILGYFMQCQGGTCPLTCNPWGGLLTGAVLGALLVGSMRPAKPIPHSPHVIAVQSTEDMDRLLSENRLALVDFYADWCGPCRQLAPTIQRIAEAYQGRAAVASVNVDRARPVAGRYQVQSIPDVRLFVDGQQVERFVGVRPEGAYRKALDVHLN